jgi:hypothetical protein
MSGIEREVERLLEPFVMHLGKDYHKYLNHIIRVIHNCSLLDPGLASLNQYILAAVFHDIGIWTHGTIDYLTPSIAAAREYLTRTDNNTILEEIVAMIEWHHKTTGYKGEYDFTVNVFRKADLVDLSFGILNSGIKRQALLEIKEKYPQLGFHRFLFKKLLRNCLRHPFNPLPMFRF